MPDVELVKNSPLRIRKKYVSRTNPLTQGTVYFRSCNTNGIDLDTIITYGVIILLELFQLHAAKGSPVTTIKQIECGIFTYNVRRMELITLLVRKRDGYKLFTHPNRKLLIRQL